MRTYCRRATQWVAPTRKNTTKCVAPQERTVACRGEAPPRPVFTCEPIAGGRPNGSPLQERTRPNASPHKKGPLSVGARHRLALSPHANLLPEGDPMGRPYKKE